MARARPVLPELAEWDPAGFQTRESPSPSVCVLAARGEGKSTALRHILTRHVRIRGARGARRAETRGPGFDEVVVVANASATLAFYAAFLPARHTAARRYANFVLLERDPGILDRLWQAQERARAGGRRVPRVLVVLDDVLGAVRHSESIERLYTRGRHANLAIVLVVQAMTTSVATAIRKNVDLWLALRVRSGPERQAFTEEVVCSTVTPEDEDAAGASDKQLARRLFAHHTSNYGVLVVDHRVKRSGVRHMVFRWRADARGAAAPPADFGGGLAEEGSGSSSGEG